VAPGMFCCSSFACWSIWWPMMAPTVPPTAAPMIAPLAVEPFARPIAAPTAPPTAAPATPPLALLLLSDEHPASVVHASATMATLREYVVLYMRPPFSGMGRLCCRTFGANQPG